MVFPVDNLDAELMEGIENIKMVSIDRFRDPFLPPQLQTGQIQFATGSLARTGIINERYGISLQLNFLLISVNSAYDKFKFCRSCRFYYATHDL